MQQPNLTIVAGCNGSGKSTYSTLLVTPGVIPFDFDKRFLELYGQLPDSELREEFAKQQTTTELETLIANSLESKLSCCFETNLMHIPFDWISRFREEGFFVEIYFFCLDSIGQAKERVAIRAKNNGHFVSDKVIEMKWKEGYKNIDQFFSEFDRIVFVDNSRDNIPHFLFELRKVSEFDYGVRQYIEHLPDYLERRLPGIFKILAED